MRRPTAIDAATRFRLQWDRAAGVGLMALGAVSVTAGSFLVGGSRYAADQLSLIVSGGLGGLLLLGAGATLVVTAGLSDEWRKLDRLEDALPYARVPEPTARELARRGRILAAGGMLVALVFLVVAWLRVSGEADPQPGLEAVATGAAGLIIGGVMAALATLSMKRRIQLRKSRVFAPWLATEPAPAAVGNQERPGQGRVVVADGLTRFHRAGCPAVAGLAVREIRRSEVPGRLQPCDLCEAE